MTEIVFSPPSGRARLRPLPLLGLALGAALIAAGIAMLQPAARHAPAAAARAHAPAAKPRIARHSRAAALDVPSPAVAGRLAAAATLGLDRGLFTASPGGVLASAARVARWRPLVVRAARRAGIDPNLLEAIVLVESSGRADAIAPGGAGAPAGLTQIPAAGAAARFALPVRLAPSIALTRGIDLATAQGRHRRAQVLEARRRRADPRFAPAHELAATAAYLATARRVIGRTDLAVASYHLGLHRLETTIHGFAGGADAGPVGSLVRRDHLSYAALYFGSAPDRHAAAWSRLEAAGSTAADYWWKVLAAERVMRLWRRDPGALAYEQRQQLRKNSAEEVLHPLGRTYRFASPDALAWAWQHHVLRAIPTDPAETHVALDRSFAQMAHRLGRSRRLYRGLRPDALAVLLFLGDRVHDLSGARQPLRVTSAVRDLRYQRVLLRHNWMAARAYSLHTTGYAFDLARTYANARQAAALQFVLDRLSALHLIAYIREPGAIHVAVASGAAAQLRALQPYV